MHMNEGVYPSIPTEKMSTTRIATFKFCCKSGQSKIKIV